MQLPICRNLAVAAVTMTCLWSTLTLGDSSAPKRRAAAFEVKFIEEMIDHHTAAIRMTDLCIDRAVHSELRDLCETMSEAQAAEIDEMQGWLADWYGISYEPQLNRKMQRQIAKLAQLDGEEFELEFLQMMIKHHEMAIDNAMNCEDRAYHPELISMCENIIAAQSAEIATMEGWLGDW